MKVIWQASRHLPTYEVRDFEVESEARGWVESNGQGQVVQFIRDRNLPNSLPEFVDRSCKMDIFQDGAWQPVNLFGG